MRKETERNEKQGGLKNMPKTEELLKCAPFWISMSRNRNPNVFDLRLIALFHFIYWLGNCCCLFYDCCFVLFGCGRVVFILVCFLVVFGWQRGMEERRDGGICGHIENETKTKLLISRLFYCIYCCCCCCCRFQRCSAPISLWDGFVARCYFEIRRWD